MGEVNEYLILEYVRNHTVTTRPEIAHALKLSAATVSRVITRLTQSGVLTEESGTSTGPGGRPRSILRFNGANGSVAGIDLGGTKCHGAIADLFGEIWHEEYITVEEAGSAFAALETVWLALEAAGTARSVRPQALAVGVPAVIDPQTGVASRGPNVGWEDFNIAARVQDFDVNFVVDNDVNLAAEAEGDIGVAQNVDDYAILSIGTGLGGASVSNRRLVKGAHNAAGEIALLLPRLEMIHSTTRGAIGGMEQILTGPSIARAGSDLVQNNPDAASEIGEKPTAKTIIEAAVAGSSIAKQVLQPALDAMALSIVTMVAVSDPQMVIVTGSVGRALDPFLPEVSELVARHVEPPVICTSQLGPNSTIRGAVSAALRISRTNQAATYVSTLTDGTKL